jgi:hypothetical protein
VHPIVKKTLYEPLNPNQAKALARILHDGFRHAVSAASEPARRAGSALPSISLAGKQFAFRPVSGAKLTRRARRPPDGFTFRAHFTGCRSIAMRVSRRLPYCDRVKRRSKIR